MTRKNKFCILLVVILVGCGSPSSFKPNNQIKSSSNSAPIATAQNITINENESKAITLSGIDPDGDTLTPTITVPPKNGIYENGIYKPSPNYYGSDSFSFIVNDGKLNSEPALVTIRIKADTSCKPLPQTGQKVTYYNNDDGDLQKGVVRSYTRDDVNGIVTDNVTNLMWQDNETVKRVWITQENYDIENFMDTAGDTATTYCKELTLGGYTDWRLPTSKELFYILDRNKAYPSINGTFKQRISGRYWSSTTLANSGDFSFGDIFIKPNSASWYVNFGSGYSLYALKSDRNNVRCVRSRYGIQETLYDTKTCLKWQDDSENKILKLNWREALDYCTNLNYNNFDDWRVPNINELFSIVDKRKTNPAIKTNFQNIVDFGLYWSSTTLANSRDVLLISFDDGNDLGKSKDFNAFVRCVRDE